MHCGTNYGHTAINTMDMLNNTTIDSIREPMCDHYLSQEIHNEIINLRDDLYRSKEDSDKRYKLDAINRFLNSTRKSYHSPTPSSCCSSENYRTSTPKHGVRMSSPPQRSNQCSFTSLDITASSAYCAPPPVIYNDHSDNHNDRKMQINYHVERIHHQVESNHLDHRDDDKKICKQEVTKRTKDSNIIPKRVPETSLVTRVSETELEKLSTSALKRRLADQRVMIKLLTEKLGKRGNDNNNNRNEGKERIQFLESKLQNEIMERTKIEEEHSEMQKRLTAADEERSTLLFTLEDLKNEARTILTAYEEASQCIPELKALLGKSAQQKEEFVAHIKRLQNECEDYKKMIGRLYKEKSEQEESMKKVSFEKEVVEKQMEDAKSNVAIRTEEIERYRTKCFEHEKEIERRGEEWKLKEFELSKLLTAFSELETSHVNLRKKFDDASDELRELRANLTKTEVKNKELNDDNKQLRHELSESSEHTKRVSSEREELLLERESILTQYHDGQKMNLEKTALLEKENNQLKESIVQLQKNLKEYEVRYIEDIGKIKDECCNSFHNEIRSLKGKNKELKKRLKMLNESTNRSEFESSNRLEFNSSNQTVGSIRSNSNTPLYISNESARRHDNALKLRNTLAQRAESQFTEQKQRELTDMTEPAAALSQDVNRTRQASAPHSDVINSILAFIYHEVENLRHVLWFEDDNLHPVNYLPVNINIEHRAAVTDIKKKLHSCVCITKTLKDRYNNQKVLITRAKERIELQMDHIRQLKCSEEEKKEEGKVEMEEMKAMLKERESIITNLQSEKKLWQCRSNTLNNELAQRVNSQGINKAYNMENSNKERSMDRVGREGAVYDGVGKICVGDHPYEGNTMSSTDSSSYESCKDHPI